MEKPWDRRSGRQVRVLSRGLPLVSGPGCPAAEVTQLGRAPPRLRGALGAASSLPSRPGQRRCDLALCWNTRTQDAGRTARSLRLASCLAAATEAAVSIALECPRALRRQARNAPHTPALPLSARSDPSHTHNVSDIGRGAVLQQQQDNVQVAHEGSHVHWCEARLRNKATAVLLLCTGLWASSRNESEWRGQRCKRRGREEEKGCFVTSRSVLYLCDSLDGSPIFHQQFHDFDAVFLAGNVQWSKTVLCKRQSS